MNTRIKKHDRRAGKTLVKCLHCGIVFTIHTGIKLEDLRCPIKHCSGILYHIVGERKSDK